MPVSSDTGILKGNIYNDYKTISSNSLLKK